MSGPQISSANRKSANFQTYFFRFADLPQKCGNLRIWDLRSIYFLRFANWRFANLKLMQIRKYLILSFLNISLKCSHSNLRTTFGFWDSSSYRAFRCLKYSYAVKKILEANGSGSETLFFPCKFCRFAICGLIITNLMICDLRTGLTQKFAALQLWNEPKNLRICDLQTNNKISVHTFEKLCINLTVCICTHDDVMTHVRTRGSMQFWKFIRKNMYHREE